MSLSLIIPDKYRTFNLIESHSTAVLSKDIVYYPFSVGNSSVNVDSFAISDNIIEPTNQKFITGYSSVVSVDSMSVLCDALSVNSIIEVEDILGQYCSYRNFEGKEILVFYNWYDAPYELNIVIIDDGDVNFIKENFSQKDLFPIAIQKHKESVILLLRDNLDFEIREISLDDYSVTSYNFAIVDNENYYYFVDIFYSNDKLYLMMNKREESIQKTAHLFVYDFVQNALSSEKIGDYPVDFFCGSNNSICYGTLTPDNIIDLYERDVYTQQQSKSIFVCNDEVKQIIPNSSYYDGGNIYINLAIEKISMGSKNNGVLYGYNLSKNELVNRLLYDYDGNIFVKYFDKNTGYKYDAPNATGY